MSDMPILQGSVQSLPSQAEARGELLPHQPWQKSPNFGQFHVCQVVSSGVKLLQAVLAQSCTHVILICDQNERPIETPDLSES